jgi:ribosome modulation factor
MPPYYKQGMRAFEKGIKQKDCPYHADSMKGRLWVEGWKAAKGQPSAEEAVEDFEDDGSDQAS